MLMNLFKFKGGVKPPTNKAQSLTQPIAVAPLPSRLVVPLHQSIGGTPRPVVQAGDKVLKGQLIGEADGWISAAVHAPTSGTVLEVAMHVQAHPSGLDALCVVIEPDGRDEWISREPLDYASMTPEAVLENKNGKVALFTFWVDLKRPDGKWHTGLSGPESGVRVMCHPEVVRRIDFD